MAKRRVSQELGLSAGNAPGVVGYQGTASAPQYEPELPSVAEQALEGLLAIGEGIAQKAFTQEVEETYLQGQLARQQGKSVEETETNPLMRPFAHGGYNDENYRITQVESEREYNLWLEKEGQQYAPDDPRVKDAISQASERTVSQFTEGMTPRARTMALMSQTKAQEAMVTKHSAAHQKYSIQEAANRVVPQGNQIITELSKAMLNKDTDTYGAVTDRAALFYSELANNPVLPAEMRNKIGTNFLKAMIQNDQRLPVEQMRDLGMLDKLPFEEREAIDSALRQSENRTLVQDLGSKVADNAAFEQAALDGEKSDPEILQYIEDNKWMTNDHAMGLFNKARKAAADKKLNIELLSAINRRDITGPTGIHALGSTVQDAMGLLDKQLRKSTATATQRVATMVSVGMDFGYMPPAYGESIAQATRAIGAAKPGEPVSTEYTDLLNTVVSLVDTANQVSPYKAGILLDAMPDDSKGALSYVINQAQFGSLPEDALRRYWANVDKVKEMDGVAKSRQLESWYKEHKDTITDSAAFNDSTISQMLGGVKFADSNYTRNAILNNVWEELRFQDTREDNWGMDEASKVQVATANVRARTIPIPVKPGASEVAPLILDRGAKVEQIFGTPDVEQIGNILTTMYPPKEGDLSSTFVWDRVNKILINKQLDERGLPVFQDVVDIASIKGAITDAQTAALDANVGVTFGAPRKVGNGLIIIDGRNSANMDRTAAFMARDLIVSNYPDAVNEIVTSNPANAQAVFRDETDLILSQVKRDVAPGYVHPPQVAAIAAAVYDQGASKVRKILERYEATEDLKERKRILEDIINPKIRAALDKQLPSGPGTMAPTYN